jgi:hypothetical protein
LKASLQVKPFPILAPGKKEENKNKKIFIGRNLRMFQVT